MNRREERRFTSSRNFTYFVLPPWEHGSRARSKEIAEQIQKFENRFCARAFPSHCQPDRKRESQHHVNGCCASRSRLHYPTCHTTADRRAAQRKSDQRRVYCY